MKREIIVECHRKSYHVIFILYVVYGISYSLLIPALPALTLQITKGDSAKSSVIYGFASFIRYALEFFSSPILGTVADVKGRKIVLLLAYLISSFEFLLLAFFPSIAMVFLTRAMSGMFDAGIATSYAIVTDIAFYNGDTVSQQYAFLGAMTGIAFIVGPYFGGILSATNLPLCFFLASMTSLIGAIACYFFLEETVYLRSPASPAASSPHLREQVLDSSLNPFEGLVFHLSNPKTRQYLIPMFLCTLTTGMSFLWYIYLHSRYHVNAVQIGCFLSYHGLINAFVQGLVIQYIIPAYLDEKNASVLLMFVAALHSVGNAWAGDLSTLYVITTLFGISIAHYPAFKSVIVNDGLVDNKKYQASLQGTISSVRTIATAIGALLYSSLVAWGMEQTTPIPEVGFILSAVVFFISWFYLRVLFITQEEEERRRQAEMQSERGVEVLSEEELLMYDEDRPILQQHRVPKVAKSYVALETLKDSKMHDESEYLS